MGWTGREPLNCVRSCGQSIVTGFGTTINPWRYASAVRWSTRPAE
jgi:hypothetical protein